MAVSEIEKRAESYKTKLKQIARERGVSMDFMMTRFVNECLIRRMASCDWGEKFCVKGGMLLPVWNDGEMFRHTADIDLNGARDGSLADLVTMVEDLADMQSETDGGTLPFLDGISIQKDSIIRKYEKHEGEEGGKVEFDVIVGKTRVRARIDVGFGNPVTPGLRTSEYPCLFRDDKKNPLPMPVIHHYPAETALAEKLHAVAQFGSYNTRIRDFYDMYVLLSRFEFQDEVLGEAIRRSFDNFGREIPDSFEGLSDEFAAEKSQIWKKFNAQTNLKTDTPEFQDVVRYIRSGFEGALLYARQNEGSGLAM